MNIQTHFKNLKKIAKKFDLDLLVLFGSRVKNPISNSDVDIAYYSDKKIDEKELFNQIVLILNYENIDLVEISDKNSIELNWNIFKTGIKIYEKNSTFFDFLLNKSFIDFVDFKENIEIKNQILNDRLNKINTKGFREKLSI